MRSLANLRLVGLLNAQMRIKRRVLENSPLVREYRAKQQALHEALHAMEQPQSPVLTSIFGLHNVGGKLVRIDPDDLPDVGADPIKKDVH